MIPGLESKHLAWDRDRCCQKASLRIKFSSVTQSCPTLWSHGLQHARPPCLSPAPGACSNSCPLSRWCHPTISSCHSFLLLPSIFSSIRVFSSESVLSIRWPKDWSFSCSIRIKNFSVCAGSYGWVGYIVNSIASFLTHLLYPLSSQVLSCIINEDEYLSVICQFLSSMSYSFSVQIFLPPWLNLFLNVLFFLVLL